MKKIFILEDNEQRIHWFMEQFMFENVTIVNNSWDAIRILNNIKYDVIYLDHDLGYRTMVESKDENTGVFVAKNINETNKDTEVIVHSWNPSGAKNIANCLVNNGHEGEITVSSFGDIEFNIKVEDSKSLRM